MVKKGIIFVVSLFVFCIVGIFSYYLGRFGPSISFRNRQLVIKQLEPQTRDQIAWQLPSSTSLINTILYEGGNDEFGKYIFEAPPDWSVIKDAEASSGGVYLLVRKGANDLRISQSNQSAKSCFFQGQEATNSAELGDKIPLAELTVLNSKYNVVIGRGATLEPNLSGKDLYQVCEKSESGWINKTRFGEIRFELAKPLDLQTFHEMEEIVSTLRLK